MISVKEKIIKEIEEINDEKLLLDIYFLFKDIQNTRINLYVNTEQKATIKEAQTEYKKGNFFETDDLFNQLLND